MKAVLISRDLYKLSKPVPAVDLVIVAVNRDLRLVTKDGHFKHVKEAFTSAVFDKTAVLWREQAKKTPILHPR